MDFANIVIIGGGVVGCAVAREVATAWSDVFLLEQLPHVGMAASTRNSGVIHSGIYYTPGSLKARLCVRGNRLMHEFCAAHGVPHRPCGKLVVATSDSERPRLEKLLDTGRANGVEGLRIVDRAAARSREPNIECIEALEVPSAGILSSEDLVKALAREAAERGASIVTRASVKGMDPGANGIRVDVEIGEPGDAAGAPHEMIEARCVVNCAGLFSDDVAAMLGNKRYRIYPNRGEYCEVVKNKSDLVRELVYPVPHDPGSTLGMHLTKTIWGTLLVGPTSDYIQDKNDYENNRHPIEEFVRRAKPMLPELRVEDLRLAYTGIRAKTLPPGQEGMADFIITHDPKVRRAIQLIGIESPGLTSSLAIAECVRRLVAEVLD
ncbi:MAG TPA: FAD-dependent oxidoreductase [Methylomirabilota bacterium]|nr:FAD-dependent oxidoreductase [Methylomirabilota bacterium]